MSLLVKDNKLLTVGNKSVNVNKEGVAGLTNNKKLLTSMGKLIKPAHIVIVELDESKVNA